MTIDRLTIATAFQTTGMEAGNATTVATAIGETLAAMERDMATLKDLELIATKNESAINKAVTRQILWTFTFALAIAGLLIALKLWP